jgi:hypothetical protein
MTGSARTGLLLGGALFAVVGVVALAVPVFTTQHDSDVAKVGSLQVSVTKDTPHTIPPLAGPAALLVGVVLMGGALMSKA